MGICIRYEANQIGGEGHAFTDKLKSLCELMSIVKVVGVYEVPWLLRGGHF